MVLFDQKHSPEQDETSLTNMSGVQTVPFYFWMSFRGVIWCCNNLPWKHNYFLTSKSVQPLLIIFVYAYKTVHWHILSEIKIDWTDCMMNFWTTTWCFIYSISLYWFFLKNGINCNIKCCWLCQTLNCLDIKIIFKYQNDKRNRD